MPESDDGFCPMCKSPVYGGVKHTVDSSGKRRRLANEVQRLCDRVTWCASRTSGDLDADLDALDEQRAVVERLLQVTDLQGLDPHEAE